MNYKKFKRIHLIVMDSVGIGEAPDAKKFDDEGSHTLGHIAEFMKGLNVPNMAKMGLGNISTLEGVQPSEQPSAYYGKIAEASVGKDTMTGHWEIMGLNIDTPFKVYPEGFPADFIQLLEEKLGRKIVCNLPYSGTAVLDDFGPHQMETGDLIVYTSADPVLQIAAHEEVIPLEELYAACQTVRDLTREGDNVVGRVIARPYIGEPGKFVRTSNRHDYALKPFGRTTMNELKDAGYDVIALGKINDIYDGEGVTDTRRTKDNVDGMDKFIAVLDEQFTGLSFLNLVDFDAVYGHRRDPQGYGEALETFDARLTEVVEKLTEDDLLIITADHGNDPTFKGTDHTREYVPALFYSKAFTQPSELATGDTFANIGATIADNFNVTAPPFGHSILSQLK